MVRLLFLIVAIALLLFVRIGCNGTAGGKWELAAENRGTAPCEIAITYGEDGSRSARVELPQSSPQVLVAESVETPLRSVTVKIEN